MVRVFMYNSLIFAISGVLLVPIIFATTSLSDVCAEIRDPNYGSGTCTGSKFSKDGETCCWREKVPGQILANTYCQTCKATCDSKGDCNEKCTEKTKQAVKLPSDESGPLGQGGILEQQPTDNNLTVNKFKDRLDMQQLEELEQTDENADVNDTFTERKDLSGSVIGNSD